MQHTTRISYKRRSGLFCFCSCPCNGAGSPQARRTCQTHDVGIERVQEFQSFQVRHEKDWKCPNHIQSFFVPFLFVQVLYTKAFLIWQIRTDVYNQIHQQTMADIVLKYYADDLQPTPVARSKKRDGQMNR